MTIRSDLHVNKLGDFALYLMCNGWVAEEPRGEWEVLRMRHKDTPSPLLIHKSKHTTVSGHLTLHGSSDRWYRKWRRALKPIQFRCN